MPRKQGAIEIMKIIENTACDYTPENLELWQTPDSWFGQPWDGYYIFLGQNRDSDCLTRSNFRCALAELGGETEDDDGNPLVTVVRESHWVCGWIEWIAIRADQETALRAADEMAGALSNYPVLDESDFSELETEEANETWERCYDWRERVEYVRRHESQFDFRDWQDMMACIRGKYFAGYASDLLS